MNVLILGGTGGSGLACAQEFLKQGHHVTLSGREQAKLDAAVRSIGGGGTAAADIYQPESLIPMFEKADVVIQAANPGYLGIADRLPPMIEAVLEAAEATAKQVVFLEGVYTYGKNPGHPVREDTVPRPVTRKGAVKQACAERIFDARWKRLRAMIVRMPDYYGPTSQLAYLDDTLRAMAQRRFAIFIGPPRPRREYLYLPDAAERIVRLALDGAAYGQTWNLAGVLLSGTEVVELCRTHLGFRTPVWFLGPVGIRLLAFFDRFLKELVEMTYLLTDPVVLDGTKYAAAYGAPQNTDPKEGFGVTLDALRTRFATGTPR